MPVSFLREKGNTAIVWGLFPSFACSDWIKLWSILWF